MAISGAAISPNMGYHSSPLVTLIMTLFNLRLGWWLGNPKNNHTYRYDGPKGSKAFFEELFGLTDDNKPYVYLSDGGHFENLGLYEMIRRRCHFIIVSDAGYDPESNFEDLANAVRKVSIDFGIEISLESIQYLRNESTQGATRPCYALGNICYSKIDGSEAKDGKLIYIKPSIRGNEPCDVLGYSLSHPLFPNEPTSNQWFSESQFESYRALGLHIMSQIIEERCGDTPSIYRLF